MDNAILSFPGFHRFGLEIDGKSNDLLRQISLAELVAGVQCNKLPAMPRIGRSNRYMTAGPRILCSVLRGAAGKI